MESTKAGLKQAQSVLEEHQAKLHHHWVESQKQPQVTPRDPSLPLDVAALHETKLVYITTRILTCRHPAMDSNTSDADTGRGGSRASPGMSGGRKLAAVAQLLEQRHGLDHVRVWNLSEVDYDATLLHNQVVTYSFPGSPSPPLGMLLKLLMSLQEWLDAHPRNVAVVHCLTGQGRTCTVVTAFLTWMGQAGLGVSWQDTLQYVAECQSVPVQELTIPSQRRYLSYFQNMLDQVRPSQPPLWLQRIILNQAPKFAQGPPPSPTASSATTTAASTSPEEATKPTGTSQKETEVSERPWGCSPYIQLFKEGKLVFTAPASLSYPTQQEQSSSEPSKQPSAEGATDPTTNKDAPTNGPVESAKDTTTTTADDDGTTKPAKASSSTVLPFCTTNGGAVQFHVHQIVQGDVLIRCRHVTPRKNAKPVRTSMFRAAFHTGYIGGNVLRLTKSQLDGACNDDDRFPNDFYVDFIFEPMDSEEAAKLFAQQQARQQAEEEAAQFEQAQQQQGPSPPKGGGSATPSTVVTASAYDTMLDRDSKFWEVIANRKQEQAKREQEAKDPQNDKDNKEQTPADSKKDKDGTTGDDSKTSNNPSQDDPFWGPTVGRRRPLKQAESSSSSSTGATASAAAQSTSAGGVATAVESSKAAASALAAMAFSIGGDMDFVPPSPPSNKTSIKPKKKATDSLLAALTGALDEDDKDEEEEHEVVFMPESDDDRSAAGTSATTGAASATASVSSHTSTGTEPVATTTPTEVSSDQNTSAPSSGSSSTVPVSNTTATTPVPPQSNETGTTTTAVTSNTNAVAVEGQDEGDINVDDVDQLLSQVGAVTGIDMDDIHIDLDGVDDDDDDLDDLENLLSSTRKT